MFKLIVLSALVAHSFVCSKPDKGRVVDGIDAEPGDIPYIVSLRYSHYHTCGASILDETHVLTAAHCVNGRSADSMSIQYGVTKISKYGNFIKIAKVVQHEKYDISNSYANDIAVLTLASPLTYDEFVQPVVLPDQDEAPPAGDTSVLAGWGYSNTEGSLMENLQRVDLLVYSDEDCQKAHGAEINLQHHVCSGVPEGGKGQCSGDSGGPLISNGKQIGIVSWSVMPCALPGFPGIYCRVSNYVDWIKENIDSN